MLLIICIWWVGSALGRRRDDCNGGGSVLGRPTGSARVHIYDTLVFKRSFMYIHWYYCVLHSIPLMYFIESLYAILSSRIYFEFYVYLWDIPRCVACWFYVFLCTLSEMTPCCNKVTTSYWTLSRHRRNGGRWWCFCLRCVYINTCIFIEPIGIGIKGSFLTYFL